MTQDLVGTTEAAAIIGVERSTLTRWRQLGRITAALQLPGTRGPVLFSRSEVERVRDAYQADRGEGNDVGIAS